ncbi:alpha/beta fold hydrolase [uncultured Jannaschia sp.]|uniref:alpha/beta fold hydrolase n=1 Tax=uncultured Jannaschia sp. TaxID=293347 RepID=UPI00261FF633|nr:alpha/beta fold hydrolase [uncultured Jannaschia sp.]
MRTILALHCLLASGASWRGLQEAMPDARLVCPDLPGHGAATAWDPSGDFMDEAAAIAWATAPDGPFDLLGHSFGGCVALRMLADAPDRIRSLALVEPVMFAAGDRRVRAANRAAMESVEATLRAGDRDGAARGFARLWGDGADWNTVPARRRDYLSDRIHLLAAAGPGIVEDVHAILPRLPADPPPVTLVTRRNPPAIVAGIADGLRERIAGMRIVRIGSGHMIPMEAPGALADVLRASLAEV